MNIPQLNNLVGRRDAYALQQPNGDWFKQDAQVTPGLLRNHLDGALTLGTYLGDPRTQTSRQLVFDIDKGPSPEDIREAYDEATAIVDAVQDLGIRGQSVGVEFSGNKGYHVWLWFAAGQPLPDLRRFARAALALAGVTCEIYPKQDKVREYGNLIGLPGGINQKSGKLREFTTLFPQPVSAQHFQRVLLELPPEPPKPGNFDGEDVGFPCVQAAFDGLPDGCRNQGMFQAAVHLRNLGVPDEVRGRMINMAADACDPPYEEPLDGLLESSKTAGLICEQLKTCPDVHCGDKCILNRQKGLSVRQKQLKFAQPGEKVVVEIVERDVEGDGKVAKTVKLGHPDIKAGGSVAIQD